MCVYQTQKKTLSSYGFFLSFLFLQKKCLSEVYGFAQLPAQHWVEFKGAASKYANGKLKDQQPSLQEVLTTPSMKNYHLRCLVGLHPDDKLHLLQKVCVMLCMCLINKLLVC